MTNRFSAQRTYSVARKEFLHIIRDPATLFFSLFIPVFELFMLGYAIDTNVRYIRTVVFDAANTKDSEDLLRAFENSQDFRIVRQVYSETDLSQAIVAGKARVGIIIPENFSRNLEAGRTATIKVVVDGSESSIATAAIGDSNAITLRESLKRIFGERQVPMDVSPQILFNPDTRSANFFIPGLMVVMCQMMAIMLSANAIVREKENGTLEQLFMTPVRAGELILGKLIPYLVLTFVEFCTILLLMRIVFQVEIAGHVQTLLALTLPFVFTMLGLGLWISTQVGTREAAGQMAMGTMMPSIFLSGYVFPLDSMPAFFWYVAQIFPTTWLIDAARGVILRGAGIAELWVHSVVLWSMGIAMFTLAMLKFHKRLT
ncbi:MAG: ABC transporter permease [Gemmataceae bacterium]|nr:ABC transporter permease [Gemmataceae bacterium]MCI0742746.1 ABC transporter permease [Gemmataceae bacterium]